jgi:predicted RNA methylase
MIPVGIIGGWPGGLMTARQLEQTFGTSVAECYAYDPIGHDPLRYLIGELMSGGFVRLRHLVDSRRTDAFRAAIRATVQPGDVVIDAGSGSGILALLAADAGAKEVFAVELDPFLATCLERTASANHFADTVRVVCGDMCTAPLPASVDVFICEMLDTGLLDEAQAIVINRLRTRGILANTTPMIPRCYNTFFELGRVDFETLVASTSEREDFGTAHLLARPPASKPS